MKKNFDCVVCGSCTVDILVKPVTLCQPLNPDSLFPVEPIETATGGIVSNSGTALARLGARTAVCTQVGDDDWAQIIRNRLGAEGIDLQHLAVCPGENTSTTVVLIDSSGQRSFAHHPGAPRRLNRDFFLSRLDLFAQSRSVLLGYYSLLPELEPDLPEVLAAIRATGCLTALDAAGSGGSPDPLPKILPHLDLYVPSLSEATTQTGCEEPRAILKAFRSMGAQGLIGVKLGARGALLSPQDGEYLDLPAIIPPTRVVDTTGAGDAFYAGLLTGILNGYSLANAGRLAAATGAFCVTGFGASVGLRHLSETKRLAGI